ncbi:phage tail tube protein [Castellaniella ginsengisoli]|uniref:Phage tail tube protein n=1 Tax=Castellaniella ginsengisoli TaxID=546114 RepID=A0AB39D2V8_9BURK
MAAELFPDGSRYYIGTAQATAINATSVSNANPAVVSATAHGLTDGDYVVVTSSWPQLDGMLLRVEDSTTDDFELGGVDTSDTTKFPTGGTLSVKKVTTWLEIPKIMNPQSSGGEQQFFTWQYLAEKIQRQKPTVKSAKSIGMEVAYDDTHPAHYTALIEADESGNAYPIRVRLPSGTEMAYSMFIGFDADPSKNQGQIMTNALAMSSAAPGFKAYKPLA